VINALPGVRVVHADVESNIVQVQNQELGFPTSESRLVMESDVAFREGWTGEAVTLGIIDTGIDPAHPQLEGSNWDSVINTPVRESGIDAGPTSVGHGSHVASTAAGKLQISDTQVFVEGVARAPIFSVQALGRVIGTGFSSEIVNAMALALDRGAGVVNMSLGSKECQGGCEICPQCRAVKILSERGVLVAVAAGNSGPDDNTINCPGCSNAAITVAAVGRNRLVAGFSSRGGTRFPGKPDVAAPGVDIFSGTGRATQVDLGDQKAGVGFAAISGTSMATPHVAGLLALLKHRDPGLTESQFKDVMRLRGVLFNTATGWGIPRWSIFPHSVG
jgi:subtilisin family serine protease